jgi:hypothetical protein
MYSIVASIVFINVFVNYYFIIHIYDKKIPNK